MGNEDNEALPEDEQAWVLSRAKFLDGNRVILRYKPYVEVLNLSKLLIPGVQIQIQMYLNSHKIWSQTHGGARHVRDITAEDLKVTLFLCQKKVEPSVYRSLMTQLTGSKKVTYPVVRSEIRSYNHAGDSQVLEAHNIFQNQFPNGVPMCLMDQTAFNSSVTKYPFSYKTFNITSIKQLVRGEEYPYRTLELNHDNSNKDLRGYHRFLQATECLTKRKGNMVGESRGLGSREKLYSVCI